MNRFCPVTYYLRDRLHRTSYEDIDEFRQLLLLERLILQPLRGWFEEALFVGLRDQFPEETRTMMFEIRFGFVMPDQQTATGLRRTRSELLRLRESRRIEHREHMWRERAAWFAAGGLP